MWKSNRSRAEQRFAAGQKRDETLIKQKEKAQNERDARMARLKQLRLAKEATETTGDQTAEPAETAAGPDDAASVASRLPRVHPHRS